MAQVIFYESRFSVCRDNLQFSEGRSQLIIVLDPKGNSMKRTMLRITLLWAFVTLSACSRQSIQEVYWGAGTSVALSEEKNGNIKEAETELRVALGRATRELDNGKIASSLHNLGAFYRRQVRLSEAIHYLVEALKLEEQVSGPTSKRTGRTLAELSAAYAIRRVVLLVG
jgi:hypothetical protein